jgi:hypothetical protein
MNRRLRFRLCGSPACRILVQPVERFGAELAEILGGLDGAFGVRDELLLEVPTAVFAAGAFERPLELAQFAFVRIGRHHRAPNTE